MTDAVLKKLEKYLQDNYIARMSPERKRAKLLNQINPIEISGGLSGINPKKHSAFAKIEALLSKPETQFADKLRFYINLKGMTHPEIYTKAGMTADCFSKIISGKTKRPTKENIFAIGLAMELSLEEMTDLLASNDSAFELGKHMDLIIQFCFENKIYSFDDVNECLVHYKLKPIGGVL